MSKQSAADILLQAEKISSLIATARALMGDGKNVDLSNLESKVQVLCDNAQNTELEHPKDVQAALRAIVDDLDKLDHEMTSQHQHVGGASLEDSIKRAIDAYSHDKEEG